MIPALNKKQWPKQIRYWFSFVFSDFFLYRLKWHFYKAKIPKNNLMIWPSARARVPKQEWWIKYGHKEEEDYLEGKGCYFNELVKTKFQINRQLAHNQINSLTVKIYLLIKRLHNEMIDEYLNMCISPGPLQLLFQNFNFNRTDLFSFQFVYYITLWHLNVWWNAQPYSLVYLVLCKIFYNHSFGIIVIIWYFFKLLTAGGYLWCNLLRPTTAQ